MFNEDFKDNVGLAVYADGRLELDMSLEQYDVFNQSSVSIEGVTLASLAEKDPSQAYSLVRRMVGSLAVNTNTVSVNGIKVADTANDGGEATHRLARSAMMDRMPESYERRIEFLLGVRPTSADTSLFGESITNRISVLDLITEPPHFSS